MNLLALLLSSRIGASDIKEWRPRYLAGLPLYQIYEETYKVEGYLVKYNFYYENVVFNIPYKKDVINELIKESYIFSTKKIKDMGVSQSDCKYDLNVHIVQVSLDTMNDNSRFKEWRTVNGEYELEVLYGFYDPTINTYRNSIILYSSEARDVDRVILHEMAHYWYDRFCIYNLSNMKTETFAKSVENLYITTKKME
jgi:hypothetical protein